jgi:hypothetical protein
VDVAGRHARDSKPRGEFGQPPVTGAIVTQERPLQLDPQMVGAECFEQRLQRRLVVDPAQGAPTQADEPLSMGQNVLDADIRLRGRPGLLARVRVRAREQPAQVRPAASILHEQGQMAALALAARSASCLA